MKNRTPLAFIFLALAFLAPAPTLAATGSGSAVADLDSRDYTLTVASAHGNPTPAVGTHTYAWRATVTASVEATVTENGTNYVNTGWTGTGSVPETGDTNTTGEIELTELASEIEWVWEEAAQTQTITLHPGDHGSISEANDGASFVTTIAHGAAFPAVTVVPDAWYDFLGFVPDAPDTVTGDFEAIAQYGFTDTDGDGLPDDWELHYFGHLNYGPDDDPDGDGRTNLEEFQDGTDPTDPASTLGLVAYYPFDGNADDASGNENHGVWNGGNYTEGVIGQGYSFSAGQYYKVDGSTTLNDFDKITIVAWFKGDLTNWQGENLVTKGEHGGSYSLYGIWIHEQNQFRSHFCNDMGENFATDMHSIENLDQWRQYVMTYDGEQMWSFVDGVAVSSNLNANGAIRVDPAAPFYINRHDWWGVNWSARLQGAVDEVRIYNRALPPEEVGRLFNAAMETPPDTSALTVLSGTGSGTYTNGAIVEITADAPASGYEFSHWTVDPEEYADNLEDANAATTTFTMPATNVTVTAEYVLAPIVFFDDFAFFDTNKWTHYVNYPVETINRNGLSDNVNVNATVPGKVYIDAALNFEPAARIAVPLPFHTNDFEIVFDYQWTGGQGGGFGAGVLASNIYSQVQDHSNYSLQHVIWGRDSDGLYLDWNFDLGRKSIALFEHNSIDNQTGFVTEHGLQIGVPYSIRIFRLNGRCGAELWNKDDLSLVGSREFDISISASYQYFIISSKDSICNHWRGDHTIDNLSITIYPMSAEPPPPSWGLLVENGTGSGTYTNGALVEITADAPASGYEFSHWTVDPEEYADNLEDVNAATTTFTMPATNVTVTAEYAEIPFFTITTIAGENGLIAPENPSVQRGSNQTFAIEANTGYHVASLEVDGESVDVASSYTFENVQTNHTLEATFALNVYTVTFNLAGGSRTGGGELEQYVPHGGFAVAPHVSPPTHYVFDDWDSSLGPITTNTTITAQYTYNPPPPPEYVLSVVSGSGSGSYQEGATISISANPAPGGKEFDRWDVSPVGFLSRLGNRNATSTTFSPMPAQSVTITAVYRDLPSYLITTVLRPGGTISPANPVVLEGADQTFTIAPTPGYHIESLLVDGEPVEPPPASYTFFNVQSTHTIEATFAPNTYTVTFDAQQGSDPDPVSKSVLFGSNYGALPSVSRVGFAFEGWWTALSGGQQITASSTVTIADDHTLYARWAPVYALTVESGSGSGSYKENAQVSIVAAEPPEGEQFLRWEVDPDSFENRLADPTQGETVFQMPAAVVTLTATYTPLEQYVITTDAGPNGSIAPQNPVVLEGADQTFSITPNTGYHIASLEVDGESVEVAPSYTFENIQTNHSIAATFEPNTYTVTLAAGGGSVDPETLDVVFHSAYGALPDPVWAQHRFDGWWTAPSGGQQITAASTVTIADDHTLHARWTPLYPLSVVNGSGSGLFPAGQVVAILANPAAAGHAFAGWVADPADHQDSLASASSASTTFTMPAANVTLTATYTPVFRITTIAGSNGSITPVNPDVPQGANQTFSITPAAGHHIASLEVDGGSVEVASSYTFFNVQATHTIAATFAPNTHTVTFILGEGTHAGGGELVQQVPHGGFAVAPHVTPPAGYRFIGWDRSLGPITTPIPIEAVYERIASQWHTVTFDLGEHGIWTGGGALTQQVLSGHAAEEPEFDVDAGWLFTNWSASFEAVFTRLDILAVYIRDPAFAELTVVSAHGAPEPAVGSYMHPVNATVTVTMPEMVLTSAGTVRTCIGWSASDGSSGSGNVAELTLSADVTLTWHWESQYELTITVDGPGSVDPTSAFHPAGSTVTLTAIPDEGYEFQGWSGAASGMTPVTQILMNGPKNVMATFGEHVVVATILNLSPERTTLGTPVSFSGSAAASGGADIVAYRWRMIALEDGVETGDFIDLSNAPLFVEEHLPEGEWRVYFDAQDSTGVWADADTRILRMDDPAHLYDLALSRADIRFFAEDGSELDPMMANQVEVGDEVTVRVTLRNQGGLAVTDEPVTVSLYDGQGPADLQRHADVLYLLATADITDIPAFGQATVELEWRVGLDHAGAAVPGVDGSFRLITALAEFTANRTQAAANAQDNTDVELPVYEPDWDNNAAQATILVGAVPLDEYTMAVSVGNVTVPQGQPVWIQGTARYQWLDGGVSQDHAVIGAMAQVVIAGQTLTSLTLAPDGGFAVTADYLAPGVYPVQVQVNDGGLTATASATVTVLAAPASPLPDLIVPRVQVSGPGLYATPSPLLHSQPDEPLTLTATIRNRGNASAQPPFAVRFLIDGEELARVDIEESLAAGASRLIVAPTVWTPQIPALYRVRVEVDPDGLVEEHSDLNNARNLDVVIDAARPDLLPYYPGGQQHTLRLEPATPVQGNLLTLGARVYNTGPVATPDIPFRVLFDLNGQTVGEATVDTVIESGEFVPVSVSWDSSEAVPGPYAFLVIVDPDDSISEFFTGNNTASTTFDLLPAMPVLVLEQAVANRSWVHVGESVTITAHVTNRGGHTYEGGRFLRLYEGFIQDGNELQMHPVAAPLAPGIGTQATWTWQAPAVPGVVTLLVHLDGQVRAVTIDVRAPNDPPQPPEPIANPQVLPGDIEILPEEYTRGDFVSVAATIRNTGDRVTHGVRVQFYYSVQGAGYVPLGFEQVIPELPAYQSVRLEAGADFEAMEPYYTVRVRLTPEPGNNRFTWDDVATRSFAVEAPWADAGPNRITVVGSAVTLDGTGSRYASGYVWEIVDWPVGSTAELVAADTATPSLTPDVAGTYRVRLQVVDGDLYSPYDWVQVEARAMTAATLTLTTDHGESDPVAGVAHTHTIGDWVPVSIDAQVEEGGVRWDSAGWTGTGIDPASGTSHTGLVQIVDADAQLYWLWAKSYRTEVSVSGEGSVSGNTGFQPEGVGLDLTATAVAGWIFSEWTGDLDGLTVLNERLLGVVDRARDLTAHFLLMPVSDLQAQVTGLDTIALSWTYAAAPGVLFRVERLAGGETEWSELAVVAVTEFTDATVAEAMNPIYRVVALLDGQESEPRDTGVVSGPYWPRMPRALIVQASALPDVMATWQAAAYADTYEVHRRIRPLGEWQRIGDTANLSWVDANVAAHTRYEYRVRARNGTGWSEFTPTVAVVVPGEGADTGYGLELDKIAVEIGGETVLEEELAESFIGAEIRGTFDALRSNPVGDLTPHRVVAGLRDLDGRSVGTPVEINELAGVPSHPAVWLAGARIPRGLRLPVEPGTYALWIETHIGSGDPRTAFAAATRTDDTDLAHRLLDIDALLPGDDAAFVALGAVAARIGEIVDVPLTIGATGAEHAFSFSVSFNAEYLEFLGFERRGGLGGSLQMVNHSAGSLSVYLLLPVGRTLDAGIQDGATLQFRLREGAEAGAVYPVNFGALNNMVTDLFASLLPHVWRPGSISVQTMGWEADVSPRGQPDGQVTQQDVMQIMRFAAGLDAIASAAEFQAADCAPIETRGDGVIDIRDAVVAGRYAGGVEPLKELGGPTGPLVPEMSPMAMQQALDIGTLDASHWMVQNGLAGVIHLSAPVWAERGDVLTVPVSVVSGGNVAGLSFSLVFDPDQISYLDHQPAAGYEEALFIINEKHVGQGVVTVAMRMPNDTDIPGGQAEVMSLVFQVAPAAGASSTSLRLMGEPVPVLLSDAAGGTVAAGTQDATIYLSAPDATGYPAAVTDLAGVVEAQPRVRLNWTASPDADSYVLYRRSSTAAWELLVELPANRTEFVDTGVRHAVSYSYRIAAVNAVGARHGDPVRVDVPSRYRMWADSRIGVGLGAPGEDMSGDGIINALAYLMDVDPLADNSHLVDMDFRDPYGLGLYYWTLAMDLQDGIDVSRLRVQTVHDLVIGTWRPAPLIEDGMVDGRRRLRFRVERPVSQAPFQFMSIEILDE